MYPAPPVTSTVIKPCLLPRSAALRSVSLTLGQCGTIAGPGATGVGALLPGPLRRAALGLADARSMPHDRGPGRHWRGRPAAWAAALPHRKVLRRGRRYRRPAWNGPPASSTTATWAT